MNGFWVQHQAGLLIFLFALILIALSNWRALGRLGAYPPLANPPRLSVLVPARDEAENIGPCLRSLLAQNYADFEVLVLDDHSTDGTGRILETIQSRALAQGYHCLRILKGADLPPGWIGKHWACHQLAQAAGGDLLLFIDADTRLHPDALTSAAAALHTEKAGLLTALPYQEMDSWGEKLVVPLLPWSVYSFWPLALARQLRLPLLSIAIGQFMLFRREAYDQSGGHAAVRSHAADDLALARRMVAHGLSVCLVDGQVRLRCRMYRGFHQAVHGFSKSLFAAFDYNPWLFAFVWAWLGIVFIEPLVILAFHLSGFGLTGFSAGMAALAALLGLIQWALFCQRCGYPLYQALLYPLHILLGLFIAAHSLLTMRSGRARWKARELPLPERRQSRPR